MGPASSGWRLLLALCFASLWVATLPMQCYEGITSRTGALIGQTSNTSPADWCGIIEIACSTLAHPIGAISLGVGATSDVMAKRTLTAFAINIGPGLYGGGQTGMLNFFNSPGGVFAAQNMKYMDKWQLQYIYTNFLGGAATMATAQAKNMVTAVNTINTMVTLMNAPGRRELEQGLEPHGAGNGVASAGTLGSPALQGAVVPPDSLPLLTGRGPTAPETLAAPARLSPSLRQLQTMGGPPPPPPPPPPPGGFVVNAALVRAVMAGLAAVGAPASASAEELATPATLASAMAKLSGAQLVTLGNSVKADPAVTSYMLDEFKFALPTSGLDSATFTLLTGVVAYMKGETLQAATVATEFGRFLPQNLLPASLTPVLAALVAGSPFLTQQALMDLPLYSSAIMQAYSTATGTVSMPGISPNNPSSMDAVLGPLLINMHVGWIQLAKACSTRDIEGGVNRTIYWGMNGGIKETFADPVAAKLINSRGIKFCQTDRCNFPVPSASPSPIPTLPPPAPGPLACVQGVMALGGSTASLRTVALPSLGVQSSSANGWYCGRFQVVCGTVSSACSQQEVAAKAEKTVYGPLPASVAVAVYDFYVKAAKAAAAASSSAPAPGSAPPDLLTLVAMLYKFEAIAAAGAVDPAVAAPTFPLATPPVSEAVLYLADIPDVSGVLLCGAGASCNTGGAATAGGGGAGTASNLGTDSSSAAPLPIAALGASFGGPAGDGGAGGSGGAIAGAVIGALFGLAVVGAAVSVRRARQRGQPPPRLLAAAAEASGKVWTRIADKLRKLPLKRWNRGGSPFGMRDGLPTTKRPGGAAASAQPSKGASPMVDNIAWTPRPTAALAAAAAAPAALKVAAPAPIKATTAAAFAPVAFAASPQLKAATATRSPAKAEEAEDDAAIAAESNVQAIVTTNPLVSVRSLALAAAAAAEQPTGTPAW